VNIEKIIVKTKCSGTFFPFPTGTLCPCCPQSVAKFRIVLLTNQSFRQTAVIEGIRPLESMKSSDQASVLFRFIKNPEFVKMGARILFRLVNN
jgi:hypothetical protein